MRGWKRENESNQRTTVTDDPSSLLNLPEPPRPHTRLFSPRNNSSIYTRFQFDLNTSHSRHSEYFLHLHRNQINFHLLFFLFFFLLASLFLNRQNLFFSLFFIQGFLSTHFGLSSHRHSCVLCSSIVIPDVPLCRRRLWSKRM